MFNAVGDGKRNIFSDFSSSSSDDEEFYFFINELLNDEIDTLEDRETQLKNPESDSKIGKFFDLYVATSQQLFSGEIHYSKEMAAKLIDALSEGKTTHCLSKSNILFIEIMNLLISICGDHKIYSFSGMAFIKANNTVQSEFIEIKQLVNQMIIVTHKIFRKLRESSELLLGESSGQVKTEILVFAQTLYFEFYTHYVRIEGALSSINTPNALSINRKLKVFFDLLYHLSHNKNFLLSFSDSMTPNMSIQESVFLHPPSATNLDLYVNALNICIRSLASYQMVLQSQYLDPIAQQLSDLEKLPQQLFTLFPLRQLISSLQEYLDTFNNGLATFPSEIKNLIISAKLDKNIPQIKINLLNSCGASERSIEANKNIFELITNSDQLWNDFKNHFKSKENGHLTELKKSHSTISRSIDTAKAAIAKGKNLSAAKQKQLFSLVINIETSLNLQPYFDIFNAFVSEPLRMPLLIFQEISLSVYLINPYNQLAVAFQNELQSGPAEFPCSAFNAFDLLIHHIIPYLDGAITSGSVLSDRVKADCLHSIEHFIYLSLLLLGPHSDLSQQLIPKKSELLPFLFTELSFLCDTLCPTLCEQNPLKRPLEILQNYLKDFRPNCTLIGHLFALLFGPINSQLTVEDKHLPLIKRHFGLLERQLFQKIDSEFDDLQRSVKERLLDSNQNGKPFWKLNLKEIQLYKFLIGQLRQLFCSSRDLLNSAENRCDFLHHLQQWEQRYCKIDDKLHAIDKQLTLLGNLAQRSEMADIEKNIIAILRWRSSFIYYFLTLQELLIANRPAKDTPRPLLAKKTPSRTSSSPNATPTDNETTVEEVEQPLGPQEELKLEPVQSSPYLDRHFLLKEISKHPLTPISTGEEENSYCFRAIKRSELLQSCMVYRALVEERERADRRGDHWPNHIAQRWQSTYMLLLEATEKIILLSRCIPDQKLPNTHIALSIQNQKPLIYTHDGALLVSLMDNADREHFAAEGVKPLIKNQEAALKRNFWFQGELKTNYHSKSIASCCDEGWKAVALTADTTAHTFLPKGSKAHKYLACRSALHKAQRNISIELLPQSFGSNLRFFQEKFYSLLIEKKCDQQCGELVQGNIAAVESIIALSTELHSIQEYDRSPLTFAVRSAEVDVAILSVVLQLILSTVKCTSGAVHPLFLDGDGSHKGRALCFTHRVDLLWKAVKAHFPEKAICDILPLLEKFLPLYIGDPRYPYPNKTPLTNEIVATYEMVHIDFCISDGAFIGSEEKKIINRHLSPNAWRLGSSHLKALLHSAIERQLSWQRRKSNLAFYLASKLLDLCID